VPYLKPFFDTFTRKERTFNYSNSEKSNSFYLSFIQRPPLGNNSSALFRITTSLMIEVGKLGRATPVYSKYTCTHVRGIYHNEEDKKRKNISLFKLKKIETYLSVE